ncbi:cytochrome P450 [Apiospora arundinis]|uniref:Cytochrome P450 n=1 Tax=Apiospora arundinis TaxID=335852 RepID=A0ABR2I065_9PEZI
MPGLTLLAIGALLAAATIINTGICLLRNYRAAKSIGCPIRIIPISPLNPFWVLLDRKVLSLVCYLPFGDNSFTRYNWRGWEVADRYRSHYEMGDIWVLVTLFKNWVYINDPDALMSMFRRGTEFTRPVFVTAILDVFGPNISTAEGQRWKTQRRIATHCFNEANNQNVWSEAVILVSDMLKYWTSKTSISSSNQDLRTLSLHVLSRAAFGKSFKFEGADERDLASSHKQSLQTILENCVLILALGTKFLSNPYLPRKLREVYQAWVSFYNYMTSVYEEEKQAFADGKSTDDNLMTMMEDSEALTEKEIYGNIFTFNFAGYDTTANTFTFVIHFVAAYPDV